MYLNVYHCTYSAQIFRLVKVTGRKRRTQAASWLMRTSCRVPRWCRSTWLAALLTLSLQVVGTVMMWTEEEEGKGVHFERWATMMSNLFSNDCCFYVNGWFLFTLMWRMIIQLFVRMQVFAKSTKRELKKKNHQNMQWQNWMVKWEKN